MPFVKPGANKAVYRRIVSAVPSITELLAYLGLEEETVGITRFCIHPRQWFRKKQRVGGTKDLKTDVIRQLMPDLIIANREENQEEQIRELAMGHDVYLSDIRTLDDALQMITDIGLLTGRKEAAEALADQIGHGLRQFIPGLPKRTLYLIWRKPWMAVSGDTFISALLAVNGWTNVLEGHQDRYPGLTAEDFSALQPELILLSSEPYPFREKHISEIREMSPGSQIILVDGELFSWYGSRLKFSTAHFRALRERIAYF